MPSSADFFVRFWGVRGTVACPGPDYSRYGGNTTCLEIRCGERMLILDAGTGLRPLGVMLGEDGAIDADILLTHTHLDHISGLPFFRPFFKAQNRFRLCAGHLDGREGALREVLGRMMAAPLFPVPLEALSADISFHDFSAGETLDLGAGISVRTARLNHPNGATGYRIDYGGKAICLVTDNEHVPGELDQTIVDLVEGAEIFIYDATFTAAEYPKFAGWGHSTWQEGVRIADAAKVRTYVVFHHAPEHDDDDMDAIAAELEKARPGSLIAYEGMVLDP